MTFSGFACEAQAFSVTLFKTKVTKEKVSSNSPSWYPRSWEGTKIFCHFFAKILTLHSKIRSPLIITVLVFCYQNCSDLLWEKNNLVNEFFFWNSRLKAKNFQNFCSWMFLISFWLEQLEFKLEKNIGIKKHAGKVRKSTLNSHPVVWWFKSLYFNFINIVMPSIGLISKIQILFFQGTLK